MGLIRSVDELSYNIEQQNRHKTRLQEISALRQEYNHLLKKELKTEFYRISQIEKESITYLTLNDDKTIETVAKEVNWLQQISKVDTSGWQDRKIKINKYKCYNSILDDLDDIYYSELNKFKKEYNQKKKIIDNDYYNKAYNYVLDGFKTLIDDDNSITDVLTIFDRDNVKEAYIEDIKDVYNYDLSLGDYNKILKAIKTLYKGNILQEKAFKHQSGDNRKNLIKDNVPLPWRILAGFEILKHFWSKKRL